MKKFLLLVLAFIFTLSLAYAQDDAGQNYDLIKLSGTIIDNRSASAHEADIAEFIATYTKESALDPDNIESGYSIYSDGKLIGFDEASGPLVAEFLKGPGSKLDVEIEAQGADYTEDLTLIKIKNQE